MWTGDDLEGLREDSNLKVDDHVDLRAVGVGRSSPGILERNLEDVGLLDNGNQTILEDIWIKDS